MDPDNHITNHLNLASMDAGTSSNFFDSDTLRKIMRGSIRIMHYCIKNNPLRIKINDPQKCTLSFKLHWLDTSITISLYDSGAISNIKTRFLRCNITADQTEFQFFIHSPIWEGLDRPQRFQSFHPRNYLSSYSFVFEGDKAGSWV